MKSVVFIQNRDFFGTRLIHLPLLYALKQAYANNEIIVLSPFKSGYFFKDVGLADEVHIYSCSLTRMLRWLRRLKPDLIVSLRPSSEWLNIAIGLSGAKVRLGYSTTISRVFFTDTVKSDNSIYRALNFLKVLELIDISATPESFFLEQAKQGVIELQENRNYFCLMPGSGAGEFKRWGISNFLNLCERLKGQYESAAFIFIIGEDERDYMGQIQLASIAGDSLILLNEGIASCARAIAASKVTIANDCGPAQIAQMMSVPYVGIFSNYDGKAHRRIAEWFFQRERALAVTTDALKDMKTIPVERVEAAVNKLLPRTC